MKTVGEWVSRPVPGRSMPARRDRAAEDLDGRVDRLQRRSTSWRAATDRPARPRRSRPVELREPEPVQVRLVADDEVLEVGGPAGERGGVVREARLVVGGQRRRLAAEVVDGRRTRRGRRASPPRSGCSARSARRRSGRDRRVPDRGHAHRAEAGEPSAGRASPSPRSVLPAFTSSSAAPRSATGRRHGRRARPAARPRRPRRRAGPSCRHDSLILDMSQRIEHS